MRSVAILLLISAPLLCATPQRGNAWGRDSWERDRDQDSQGRNRGDGRKLSDRVFYYDNGQVSAHCGAGQQDWSRLTWTAGAIRPEYYENQGWARNIEQCMRICDRDADCYFATLTSSNTCYLLTTSNRAACRYMKSGHYGPPGEHCTTSQPCPSAYRVCKSPNCTLLSIMEIYCKTNDVDNAVSTCKGGSGRRLESWERDRGGGRKLSDRIFYYDSGQVSAYCGAGQQDWYQYTLTAGAIRPEYYENQGWARNIEQCMRICDRDADCYFATLTSSKTCYLLTTSNRAACRYMKSGHYGPPGERCTTSQPCPSAYRVCRYPNCTLLSIMETYCKTNDVDKAVSTCKGGSGRSQENWERDQGGGRRLSDRIFYYDNGQVSAHCGAGQQDWYRYTWTTGSIRPDYYENQGWARNIEQCMRTCDRDAGCYFATLTSSNTCYLLTTSNRAACRYMKSGHYGPPGERCTTSQPCPSAYRVCKSPDCTLMTIMEVYCKTNDVERAVNTCRRGL